MCGRGLNRFLQSLADDKIDIRSQQLELARVKNKLRRVANNYRKKKQRVHELFAQLKALEDEKQNLIFEKA
jgi:septal ring factor EnvC (AmiA/AmiB activator)